MLTESVLPNRVMKWGKGFSSILKDWVESNNNFGLLRGDTQCYHNTTSFNFDVYDLHLLLN